MHYGVHSRVISVNLCEVNFNRELIVSKLSQGVQKKKYHDSDHN